MPNPDIEARIAELEELSDIQESSRTATMQSGFWHSAEFAALKSVVRELALQAGVSCNAFDEHMKLRQKVFHDHFLRKLEDFSTRRSAELDDRTLDEVPTTDGFPPLFP